MKTGFISVRLSLAGFIVPYLFVYEPAMLLIDPTGLPMNAVEFPMASIVDILIVSFTSIVGVIGVGAAIEGYFATHLNSILRILLGAGALMMLIPEPITDIIGTTIVFTIFVMNFVQSKKEKKEVVSAA